MPRGSRAARPQSPEEAPTVVETVELATSAALDVTADREGQASGEGPEAPVEFHSPQIVFDRYHVVAKVHWDGIIAWQDNRLSNGLLEARTHSPRRPNAGLAATAPKPR